MALRLGARQGLFIKSQFRIISEARAVSCKTKRYIVQGATAITCTDSQSNTSAQPASQQPEPASDYATGNPSMGHPVSLTAKQQQDLCTIVREALASEAAAKQFIRAQRAVLGQQRTDLAAAEADRDQVAAALTKLAPDVRARPSLLSPIWAAAGATFGAFAGTTPKRMSDHIRGGAAQALAEQHTGHLRRLAALGIAAGHPAVEALRATVRKQRDVDSVTSPPLPDLMSIAVNQELLKTITVPEVAGATVKFAFQSMAAISSSV